MLNDAAIEGLGLVARQEIKRVQLAGDTLIAINAVNNRINCFSKSNHDIRYYNKEKDMIWYNYQKNVI